MLKNIYFASCIALTASLLWVSNGVASERHIDQNITELIAEYTQGNIVLERSGTHIETNTPTIDHNVTLRHGENDHLHIVIYPRNPNEYFSVINFDCRNNQLLENTQGCRGALNDYDPASSLFSMIRKESLDSTKQAQSKFGDIVVPENCSSCYFPKINKLVTVLPNHCRIQDTQTIDYPISGAEIDAALNRPTYNRIKKRERDTKLLLGGLTAFIFSMKAWSAFKKNSA